VADLLSKGEGLIEVKGNHFKWDTPIIKTLVKSLAGYVPVPHPIRSGSSWAFSLARTAAREATAGYQLRSPTFVFFILPAWDEQCCVQNAVGQNPRSKAT
jgi:hypothetical protein